MMIQEKYKNCDAISPRYAFSGLCSRYTDLERTLRVRLTGGAGAYGQPCTYSKKTGSDLSQLDIIHIYRVGKQPFWHWYFRSQEKFTCGGCRPEWLEAIDALQSAIQYTYNHGVQAKGFKVHND